MKAVDVMHPLHKAQLIAYLRAGRYPLGFVFNFHVERFRAGFTRLVNTKGIQ